MYILAAVLHGIFSDVVYDTFKELLIKKKILKADESNKIEVLHEYIYERYNYCQKLPPMKLLEYAYTDEGSELN